jgi:hypothetical protein
VEPANARKAKAANARKAKAYKMLGGCHSHLYNMEFMEGKELENL